MWENLWKRGSMETRRKNKKNRLQFSILKCNKSKKKKNGLLDSIVLDFFVCIFLLLTFIFVYSSWIEAQILFVLGGVLTSKWYFTLIPKFVSLPLNYITLFILWLRFFWLHHDIIFSIFILSWKKNERIVLKQYQ